MIVPAPQAPAGKGTRTPYPEPAGQFSDVCSHAGKPLGHSGQPVAFLDAEAFRIIEYCLALSEGPCHGQNGHQVGDLGSVYFDAAQPGGGPAAEEDISAMTGEGIGFRPELGEEVENSLVSLKGTGFQSGDAHISANRSGGQEEGGLGPVSFHKMFPGSVGLPPGDFPSLFGGVDSNAEGGKGLQCHLHIGGALQGGGQTDFALSRQKRQG